jgi:hypothetical protein
MLVANPIALCSNVAMTNRRLAKVTFPGVLTGLVPAVVHAASSDFLRHQSAASQSGYIAGELIGLLALLAGALKCMTMLSRPTASRLCVTSLMLVLLGWLGAAVSIMVQRHTGVEMTSLTMMAAVGSSALLFAAGLVIGIIGLVTYKRDRYIQGRAQAIWAVLLSSIYLLIFGSSFVYGVVLGIQKRAAMVDRAADGESHTYEKPLLNFSITPPADARWASLKPEVISPVATLAFHRTSPSLYCLIVAESLGDSKRLTTEFVSEFAKSNLASTAKVSSQHEQKETVNGRVFNHIISNAKLSSGDDFVYEHWIAVLNGYSYQLIFWTKPENATHQAEEAKRMLDSFRMLDPDHKAIRLPSVKRETH